MYSIRNKIFLGVLFLFSIIIILSVINLVFINQIAKSSKGTISDNYRTIDYMTAMLVSLDNMHSTLLRPDSNSIKNEIFYRYKNEFDSNFTDEANNITEPGERELVNELQFNYDSFIKSAGVILGSSVSNSLLPGTETNYDYSRANIVSIYRLNMDAILNKSSASEQGAHRIIFYTLFIGGFSIILTLFFVLTFPSRIVKPIRDLTDKIGAISQKDYNQKLDVNYKDEIGQLARAFNIMAAKLKDYESQQIGEILTGKQRLEALVQNMQDGIIVLDNNNKVVLANQVLAELTGINVDSIINKNISDIAAGNDLLRVLISEIMTNQQKEPDEKRTVRIIRNKKEYYYEPELIRILTNSENPYISRNIGNMIILRNITRFEERDVAKTNLISTVSHEMKTPISSINLVVKLLEDSRVGELNLEQKELIQSIKEQNNRLSKVVNEILSYSQIETGNIRLNFSDVQPEDIIDYATTALMILISEKNIQLETEIEDNLPSINIDIEKTVWVLVNLLSNAIRYSKQNDKIILSTGKQENSIFFSVKDFGPGISEEDQKKLFGRFTQLGRRGERGWGLGLAIAKEFVQAQGGSILVKSSPGEGSTFIFTMPV
jgi:NtrC-family two-component system sensor histidine kinase KinB